MPMLFSSEAQAAGLANYLAGFSELGAVRIYKAESDALLRRHLAASPPPTSSADAFPRRMLEVGCGLGDDLATFIANEPEAILGFGLDHNASLLRLAEERHAQHATLQFVQGEITGLPFRDGFFSACRADRVLQHVADSSAALRELHRVLSVGGVLLLLDTDWQTLVLDCSLPDTTQAICEHFRSGIAQPYIGRRLRRHCTAAGFRISEVCANTLSFADLEKAEAVLGLQQAALAAMDAGVVTADAAVDWITALRAQSERGEFFCAVTGFAVCAVKTEHA